DLLRTLGRQPGLLGDIFSGAQSRFNNPVNLKRMITLIDETEWTALDVDVKAEAFEGLLEKAASEGKKGAGQYFTPRVLIKSIVRCMKPDPRVHREFTIGDPACGTRGANQAPDREDFTIETSNKQLNFLQHVLTILKPGGRAAVVLPDNCLFESKAGEVIEILMQDCNLHNVLRLPRGTFTPY